MEIKTTAELKKAYPQLCEEIAAEATNAERERIKGIENTTIPGFEDMANKAKFENITDEAGFAVMCLKAQKEASQQFEGVRAAELTNSGAGQVVSPREPEGGAEEENEILAAARKIYGKEKK